MPLSDPQLLTLTTAAVLMPRYAAVLSEFECEKIAEAGHRLLREGREATVTSTEWLVIESAVEALALADRRGCAARRRPA